MIKQYELWFLTGSQDLYGEETLKQVALHSQEIATALGTDKNMPVSIVYKPVLKSTEEISALIAEVNFSANCIGIITWMHTFSPSKMWIKGISALQKPILHLHTQYNRDIPWSTIDMDFMNLNQSAHGDREFGFLLSRMQVCRKVVVGHWQDPNVVNKIGKWSRVCLGKNEFSKLQVARFGDNMRYVAVTEGNKVSAEIKFGFSVNTFGVGDLAEVVNEVSSSEINALVAEYESTYTLAEPLTVNGSQRQSLLDAAQIEIGIERFLKNGGFGAFTNTFEDLHGLKQLPGIASQRLMAKGYGFAAEGDWKTAALLRAFKVMATGLEGGNSFMEDYTYHFQPGYESVLGAHMLEICPSISSSKPSCEIHPLGIGGKDDPVRLVFNGDPGNAINISLVDLGHRFRLIINTVEAEKLTDDLPHLPVARALWKPMPDMAKGCEAWLIAGGAHHTVYSQNISVGQISDLAEMLDIELVVIDENTSIRQLKRELRYEEAARKLML